jgi:hypothetical protein
MVAVGNAFDDVNINAIASGAQHVQKVADVFSLVLAINNITSEACTGKYAIQIQVQIQIQIQNLYCPIKDTFEWKFSICSTGIRRSIEI